MSLNENNQQGDWTKIINKKMSWLLHKAAQLLESLLDHFILLVSFYTLWKYKKTRSILMFSKGIYKEASDMKQVNPGILYKKNTTTKTIEV